MLFDGWVVGNGCTAYAEPNEKASYAVDEKKKLEIFFSGSQIAKMDYHSVKSVH